MKTKTLFFSIFSFAALIMLTAAGYGYGGGHNDPLNSGGTSTSTGAPGEPHTCSQAGCHGAGNGSNSTGGLPDNGGPGSMTWTSVPQMTNNQYTPGQTYTINATVSETGKTIFGLNMEFLDNSGNTNTQIDNTMGTYTMTTTETHIMRGWGTGRQTVTHTTNGGLSNNAHAFSFQWTAPASGIVNVYWSGVAGNHDNLPNAQDNVYKGYVQLSSATDISSNASEKLSFEVFPNPVSDNFNVSCELKNDATV
ncbi:MAG TPA: choice-of-anchor V domain-containing protein, partial [Bacteroidia bacterium]